MCLLLLVLACSHYPDAPSLPELQIPFSSLAHGVVSGPSGTPAQSSSARRARSRRRVTGFGVSLQGCAGTTGNCSRAGLSPCPRARREAFASRGCGSFSSQGFGALCSQTGRASSQQCPSSIPVCGEQRTLGLVLLSWSPVL